MNETKNQNEASAGQSELSAGVGVFEVILEGGIADGKTFFIKTNSKSLMIPVPEMGGYGAAIYYPTDRVGHKGKQIWA